MHLLIPLRPRVYQCMGAEKGGYKPRGTLVISAGCYVVLNIWKRNLHERWNPYGKSISVGAFGHILNSCGVKNVNEKFFPLGLK
jgi:hypothetical protein